jgi:hypothetical protein
VYRTSNSSSGTFSCPANQISFSSSLASVALSTFLVVAVVVAVAATFFGTDAIIFSAIRELCLDGVNLSLISATSLLCFSRCNGCFFPLMSHIFALMPSCSSPQYRVLCLVGFNLSLISVTCLLRSLGRLIRLLWRRGVTLL